MIRRADVDDFLLITQHDHALISGEIAEYFGNEYFAQPEPRAAVLLGVAQHDCGWPLHDDEPTLNKNNLPLDVFEVPRDIALKVWTASADRATAKDRYAGLLVSMHVLALSVFVTTQPSFAEQWGVQRGPEMFAIAKLQQKEIERQDNLRAQLGLRNEKTEPEAREALQHSEDLLNFNFRMLQAMDLLSLSVCCTKPPSLQTQDVLPQPGAAPMRLDLRREGNDLIVDPWPFSLPEIELKIPACRLSAQPFESSEAFAAAWKSAPAEVLTARILPSL